MGILSRDASGAIFRRSLWRSRAWWVGIVVVTAFLFVACGSGGSNTDADATDDGSATEPKASVRSADAAPDFELVLFETENHAKGESLRLSQLLGSPVVVNFWFPSCPPCVAEMPEFERSFQKHRTDEVKFIGVQLLGLDTAEEGQSFIDDLGVTYAIGPDEFGDIIRAYKITGFPSTLFLDSEQNIVRKWTGILDAAKLEELVQELLN